jgi:hypothetical protein
MRCEFDVAHGPTCYCHRPGTSEFNYGGVKRMLCLNHWHHEDMRLHHPKLWNAYLKTDLLAQEAAEFRAQYEAYID